MTTIGLVRTLSGFLAMGCRSGEETQETTDRWRDKRAQGALRSGGCFCWGIASQTHIAPQISNVHQTLKSLVLFAFSHLAGARHAR